MLRLRRWLFRNPLAPTRTKPVRKTRLGMEQLEAREVPAAVRPGVFIESVFPGNDDGSVGPVALGFNVRFAGGDYSHVYVNNNGNVTFGQPVGAYTPSPIGSVAAPMLAPFWADVDTRGGSPVSYGTAVVDGRPAFGVNWPGVGYFEENYDQLNTFQLVLVDRSDLAPGAFSVEFNYDGVRWETGDASGGFGGFGGTPARAGYSTGPGAGYELAGSGISGAFVDGGAYSLVAGSMNSGVAGRYTFWFGGVPASSIGGVLWNDANQNGTRDGGENALAGVAVTLSASGQADRSATTASDGAYRFDTLAPGAYSVAAAAPAGFAFTLPASGTRSVLLTSGQPVTDASFGLVLTNRPPVAGSDTLATRFGRPGSLNVLANDTDPDGDPLNVSGYTQPTNGSVAVDSTGLAIYSPTAGFSGSDSFTYSVADGKGGTATGTVSVTVAPPPTVTVTSSGQASEAGATARLTFARTDSAGDLVVNFTAGGSATFGSKNDYTLSAGTLVGGVGTVTIPDGQSSVTVDLIAVDDPWFEPTETATFDVAGGSGYVVGGTTAKVDILDDDAATTTVSLVPTYLTLDEGKAGTLTVRRTGGSSASLAATVQLANNPAVAVRAGLNSDYTLTDAAGNAVVVTNSKFPVAFADGQSEVTFTVAATGDNRVEPDEGVRFQLLAGGTAFAIGNKTSDLTVRDATPQVSITPASRELTEGGSGSFTVSRTGSTAGALAVSVRVEANPAFPTRAGWNSDYTLSLADGTVLAVSGGAFTITIPDGQDSFSFDLNAKADGVIEVTDGVRLRVASGSTYAAASGYSSADVSIADATPQVSITPSTAEVAEGASGTLTLTRTGDTSSSLVVMLRAETNPAFPTRAAWNTDYTLYSLTLPDGTPVPLVGGAFTVTIPAGQSSLALGVNGLPDNKTEVTEGVRFRVAGNTVYAAKPGEATADIALLDRTPVVTISPNALTVPEGSSGSFTVTWTGDTSGTSSDRVVTLQLATNPGVTGRATWNTDYTLLVDGQTLAVSGGKFTVTIPAGSSSQTVSIAAKTDTRVEGPEGLRVQVVGGTGYAPRGAPLDAVITDDPPTVSVTGSTNAEEGGASGTFTLTRSGGDLSQPLTAWFSLGGTATKTSDFTVSGATYSNSLQQYKVTFPGKTAGSGASSATVTITAVNDAVYDPDETVTLSVATGATAYSIGSPGTNSLTIVDNEPDAVVWVDASAVVVGAVPVPEGATRTLFLRRTQGDIAQPLTISLSLPADTDGNQAVEWGTNATLTGPDGGVIDPSGGTVTFAAGVAELALTLKTRASELDGTVEDERAGFRLTIVPGGSRYEAGDPSRSDRPAGVDVHIVARPSPIKQAVTTEEGTPASIVLSSVVSDGLTVAYATFAQPMYGTLSIVGNVATYTPDDGFVGIDSFLFQASTTFDGVTLTSNPGVVRIAVTGRPIEFPPDDYGGFTDGPAVNLSPEVFLEPGVEAIAGTSTQFAATVDDPDGSADVVDVQWDFDYDWEEFHPTSSAAGSLTPSFTFAEPGAYFVAVRVTDSAGNSAVDFTSVWVDAVTELVARPGRDLFLIPDNGPISFAGSFFGPNSVDISTGVEWDFDYDGLTFTPDVVGTLTPSFNFVESGFYSVALRVTDATGESAIGELSVTVTDLFVGPTANAGPDQTVFQGQTVTFSGSYSAPEGTVAAEQIEWDFHYNGFTFHPETFGTLNPTYSYSDAHDYPVALRITDSNGVSEISVLTVFVTNVAPIAVAGVDQSAAIGDTLTFAGIASDAGGADDIVIEAWDFNYDGILFTFDAVGNSSRHTFVAPGVYTVAYQVADIDGSMSIDTLTVTVRDVPTLVVWAGHTAILRQGDSMSLSGRFFDLTGGNESATFAWDFDFDGNTFLPDSTAVESLNPSHKFSQAGDFLVAFRVTNADEVSRIDTVRIVVDNVLPGIDPGNDLRVSAGGLATFGATIVDGLGYDVSAIEWDFDYDGSSFQSDSSGSASPSHTYSIPGFYTAAVRVTDSDGEQVFGFVGVEVMAVPPVATVAVNGPSVEGGETVFTVGGVVTSNPAEQVTVWADFTGSGDFERIDPAQITPGANGAKSFSFTYRDSGVYAPVIRLQSETGAFTDYPLAVTVANVAPTAVLLPSTGVTIQPGDAISFVQAADPSDADLDSLTYFLSYDQGSTFASSPDGTFFLPDYVPGQTYTVVGFVRDKDGGVSPLYSTTVKVYADVALANGGTGAVELTWAGGGASVVLGPGETYHFGNAVTGLTVTLLTSGASYTLRTNGSLSLVQAAAGVTSVDLTINTGYSVDLPNFVGDGSVGAVLLPSGTDLSPSRLSLIVRGNVGDVVASDGPGEHDALAGEFSFQNLVGSITGFDTIDAIHARGLLGTDPSQIVEANSGIGIVTAAGIGATVDPAAGGSGAIGTLAVGAGGVTGSVGVVQVLERRDADGRVTSITDGAGNETAFSLDAGGNVVGILDPLGQSTTRVFDALGRLSAETDRNGIRRVVSYTSLHQVASETWYTVDGTTILASRSFTYDSEGRRLTAQNAAGNYTFTYDAAGRLATQTDPSGVVLTFGYDGAGNVATLADTLGGLTESVYDPATGRLVSRRYSGTGQSPLRVDFTYTDAGQVATVSRYSDLDALTKVGDSIYLYDASHRVIHIQHRSAGGAVLTDYVYTYTRDGNLASTTTNGSVVAYTYDANGQLTGDGVRAYAYDAAGNRNLPGYVVGVGNRLLSDGSWDYAYDAEGNVVAKSHARTGESWTYSYLPGNLLSTAEHRAADDSLLSLTAYQYDAFGLRLSESVTVPGQSPRVTRFAYAGSQVLADLDDGNQLLTRYLRGDAVDSLYGTADAAGDVAGYLSDNVGSVRAILDPSGQIVGQSDYDPFGNLIAQSGASNGRYGWTGREFDATTGLYHGILGRQYDPATGRWTGEDVLKFGGGDANLFRYVNNQPLTRTDPSGQVLIKPIGDGGAGFRLLLERLKSEAIVALGKDAASGFPAAFTSTPAGILVGLRVFESYISERFNRYEPIYQNYDLVNNFDQIPAATLQAIRDFLNKIGSPDRGAIQKMIDGGLNEDPVLILTAAANDPGTLILTQIIQQQPPAGAGSFGVFFSQLVNDVKSYPDKIQNLWALIDRIAPLAAGAVPKFYAALRDHPDAVVANLVGKIGPNGPEKGGLQLGFEKFLSQQNLATIKDEAFKWLFGGLKEKMKDLSLPSVFTQETVTKLAVDVLTQLSGADKIDLAYLKGVIADVTGFDADSVLEHVDALRELLAGPDPLATLVEKLDGLSKGIFDDLLKQAQDLITQTILPKVITNLAAKLSPQTAVLSTLYNGLNWILDPQTLSQIEQVAKDLFAGIDTALAANANPEAVGNYVRDVLNKSIPLVLGLVQKQLLGGINLPQVIQDAVKKVDLRTWIEKGIQKTWDGIRKNLNDNVLNKIAGKQVTERVAIGDPIYLWGVRRGDEARIVLAGKRLAEWIATAKNANVGNANLVASLDDIDKLRSSIEGSVDFRIVVQHDRVRPRPTTLPQSVINALDKVNSELRNLGTKINKVLAQLGGFNRPVYDPLPLKYITTPYGLVGRAQGVRGRLTAQTFASAVRTDFDRGAKSPWWWEAFTTAPANQLPNGEQWERGHLLGSQLGGPGGTSWDNMVPLPDTINSPLMAAFEAAIRRGPSVSKTQAISLRNPFVIDFSIIPIYPNATSLAPSKLHIVAFSIDRERTFDMDIEIPCVPGTTMANVIINTQRGWYV